MSKKSESQDDKSGAGYVNVGLQRWEKIRAEWRRPKAGSAPRAEVHAKNIDVEEFMERVFSLTVGGTLPEPIPLGQMIDILIDSWEADGLFDICTKTSALGDLRSLIITGIFILAQNY